VERQPNGITLDLDVPFLHYVEKRYLNLSRQVGELIDREDAAIRSRQKTEVDRQFVRKQMTTPGGADGIHVSDEVRDGDIGRRKLLDVAGFGSDPGDGGVVAVLLDEAPSVP